jgi:hypothetical protein
VSGNSYPCIAAAVVDMDVTAAEAGKVRISYRGFRAAGDSKPAWTGSFTIAGLGQKYAETTDFTCEDVGQP